MESADLRNGDDPATWLAFDDPWVGTVVVERLVATDGGRSWRPTLDIETDVAA